MINECDLASILCRGKVTSNRSKYLRKLNESSSEQRNIHQFGVDYSKKKTSSESDTNTVARVSSSTMINLNTNNTGIVGKHSISTSSIRISPSRFETNTKLQLQKSPELPRKYPLITTSSKNQPPSSIRQRSFEQVKENVPTNNKTQLERSGTYTIRKFDQKINDPVPHHHHVAPPRSININTNSINATNRQINQILSPQSEPDINTHSFQVNNRARKLDQMKDNSSRLKTTTQLTSQHRISPRKSTIDPITIYDPSLISVAQRASSIMNRKKQENELIINQPMSTAPPPPPLAYENEQESNEPIMSLRDRINCYRNSTIISSSSSMIGKRASIDDSTMPNIIDPSERPKSIKSLKNRFKTQPISLDDLAKANAAFLDHDGASTIASPTMSTNSRETLVDITEEMNSPIKREHEAPQPVKVKKSQSILKAQKDLINQTKATITNSRSFDKDDEEVISGISVKKLAKHCYENDQNTDTIDRRPSKPLNNAILRKIAFKNKTSSEDKEETPVHKLYTRRTHTTQPITLLDLEETEMKTGGQSIQDRIANMKQHGETSWKVRHQKINEGNNNRPRPVSVYDIQKDLKNDQDNWKNRVEPKDVKQFTYENKIRNSMLNIQTPRQKNRLSYHENSTKASGEAQPIPTIQRFKSNQSKLAGPYVPPQFILSSNLEINTATTPGVMSSSSFNDSSHLSISRDIRLNVQTQVVAVPQMSDETLSKFFPDSSNLPNEDFSDITKPTTNDFNDIFLESADPIMVQKRPINPRRPNRAGSKNPLKLLQNRKDIKSEYVERITDINEHELRRQNIENIQSKVGFAEEALAGLSSKEDFSKVQLKKRRSNDDDMLSDENMMKKFELLLNSPYKDKMLILIKGRKRVQVRIMKPNISSINEGDCYILLTKLALFIWLGECSNVIERNKANDLANWIIKTKDLNYRSKRDKPIVIDHLTNSHSNNEEMQFWKALGYDSGIPEMTEPVGDENEDETYENLIQSTNLVFQVIGNQLVPVGELWGKRLNYSLLADNKVFIFDFGTELYMWKGSKSNMLDNSYGKDFLKQLYYRGYDYTGSPINPIDPLPRSPSEAESPCGNKRPDWVIIGRLPQNCETVLFKEKFIDWPDPNRMMGVISTPHNKFVGDGVLEDVNFQPADLSGVLSAELSANSSHLIIDGRSVGRGGNWKIIEDGILREFSVETIQLKIWRIVSGQKEEVDQQSYGQFCSSEAYILHWLYEIKTLGRYKRNSIAGVQSSAYFFWQGSMTSVTEKAASALLTVELDREQENSLDRSGSGGTSQIRVLENEEAPAFCRLFEGSMIVHNQKLESASSKSKPRLFVLRGELKREAHFVEVRCKEDSMRSRSVFLLLTAVTKLNQSTADPHGYLWYGRYASNNAREAGKYSVESIIKLQPSELGGVYSNIIEIEEENTSRSFWSTMCATRRWFSSYQSSSLDDALEPIRGWHASAVTGQFQLTELRYSLQPDYNDDNKDVPGFPLVQSMLYSARQPALFIIWTPGKIYLWQGWWQNVSATQILDPVTNFDDSASCSSDGDSNWSLPQNRIAAEKLAVLKTINNYLSNNSSVTNSIVYAGLEPPEFQELFPFWNINEEAQTANIKKGYKLNQTDDINKVLQHYLTATYSIEELRATPLPEVVIPWKQESYLSDQDFEKLFEMTKSQFYSLPTWKQRDLKIKMKFY